MIRRSIGQTVIDISADLRVPAFTLPLGEPFEKPVAGDINVTMEVGYLCVIAPGGTAAITRGAVEARIDGERIIWTHPAIGPFIEGIPELGRVRIMMPLEEWLQTKDVLQQVLLPGLLSPLSERRIFAMHASAVIFNGKGILFAGPTGSGKTTAALRMVDKGATLVAEDLVFLTLSPENTIIAWGLGNPPRADASTWERFPEWNPEIPHHAGKLTLDRNLLPWATNTAVDRLIWLGNEKESGAQRLISLLSVTFHAHGMEQTSRFLSHLIEGVECLSVSHPDEAFFLALEW